MTIQDKNTVDILNDLIEVTKDGQYGFEKCAERVESPQLAASLRQRAAECEAGARELQSLVMQYGGKPEDSGSMKGAMHRGWVSMKDTLTGNSDHAVLEEAERGEDAALERYRKATAQDLPRDVADVVQRQLSGVQRNHDQIKALRDSIRT